MYKQIPDFPLYEVSSNGDCVRNIKTNKIFFPSATCGKYISTTLRDENNKPKTVYMHRLVASAFHPNPQNKQEVNHIDGVQTNNHPDNLEWVTRLENSTHAWDNGLKQGVINHNKSRAKEHFQKMGRAKRKYSDDEIRFMRSSFNNRTLTQKELSVKFNTNVSNMGRILRGERYSDIE